MLAVDTNILFYSLNPTSAFYGKAKRFLQAAFADTNKGVGIADYILVELYLTLEWPCKWY